MIRSISAVLADPWFWVGLGGALMVAIAGYVIATRPPRDLLKSLDSLGTDVRRLTDTRRREATSESHQENEHVAGSRESASAIASESPDSIAKRIDAMLESIPERMQSNAVGEKKAALQQAAAELEAVELSRVHRHGLQALFERVQELVAELNNRGALSAPIGFTPFELPTTIMFTTADLQKGKPQYVPTTHSPKITFPSAGEWWFIVQLGEVGRSGDPPKAYFHVGTNYRLPLVHLFRSPTHRESLDANTGQTAANGEDWALFSLHPDGSWAVEIRGGIPEAERREIPSTPGQDALAEPLLRFAQIEIMAARQAASDL